jgi:oxalate decarboxylase
MIRDLPQPMRDGVGATIMGPHNVPLERENPHLLASPDTDAGTIPNLKFSFSAAHNRLLSGGWSREVTVRELPISTTMAGGRGRPVELPGRAAALHPGAGRGLRVPARV